MNPSLSTEWNVDCLWSNWMRSTPDAPDRPRWVSRRRPWDACDGGDRARLVHGRNVTGRRTVDCVSSPPDGTPFPASSPPEVGTDATFAVVDERPSESHLHALAPMVALAIADPRLRDSLSALMHSAGHLVGGDDNIPVAAVVITDAGPVARPGVASLRARTRSDAAIIVVLGRSAPASQVKEALEAGAVLCLKVPVDEHQLLAVIGSAIDLHTAKVHADDLMRQLDVQGHLASLGRVTAGFTHEVANPLSVLVAGFEAVRADIDRLLQARELLAIAVGECAPSPTMALARECLSQIPSTEEVRRTVDDMGTALGRINGVLATTRALARGTLSSRVEDVDLASVVRDVRRWATDDLEGVEVEELMDEPVVARADPQLLSQIVLNLVTNAAHAARQLPSPRVRLHVYGSNETAVVSVRDNGPGVPSEVRDRIFEPFFTTRRDQGGTGLGLSLCREYATQMQAHVTLWSAPGRGACFRVRLRRAIP
jgi:signal transduction histidine kinase